MFKSLTVKDYITTGILLAGIVAWGSRLESKMIHHASLPYHPSVPEMVERRIKERIELARARDAATLATLVTEIKHLRAEVSRMRMDISNMHPSVPIRSRRQ